MMPASPSGERNGSVQYSLPVIGSSDTSPSMLLTINCRLPPAVRRIGGAGPPTNLPVRHISFPVSLFHATTAGPPCPRTTLMTSEPSIVGGLVAPEEPKSDLNSVMKSLVHSTSPVL